jgi:transcriptional regulator with XRE-family HTH domain
MNLVLFSKFIASKTEHISETIPKNEQAARRIKAELVLAGISQTEIANLLGVKAPAVNAVVCGRRSVPRIMAAIADAVGRPVSDLWPEEQKNTPTPAGRNSSSVGDGGRAPDPSRG